MGLNKIIWAVAALAAIVFAFVSFEYSALILALLGLVSGFFVVGDHRRSLLIAAIFLMGGASALNGIPAAGEYLTSIFQSYGMVLNAASLMVIVMATAERLIPGMKSE